MKNPVERLLYVALVMIFFGVGIAFYVVARLAHNQAQQLKAQRQNIDQIKTAVLELKANNSKNTKYLECIISLHARGIVLDNQVCTEEKSIPTPSSSTPVVPPAAHEVPEKDYPVANFVRGVLDSVGNALKGLGQ